MAAYARAPLITAASAPGSRTRRRPEPPLAGSRGARGRVPVFRLALGRGGGVTGGGAVAGAGAGVRMGWPAAGTGVGVPVRGLAFCAGGGAPVRPLTACAGGGAPVCGLASCAAGGAPVCGLLLGAGGRVASRSQTTSRAQAPGSAGGAKVSVGASSVSSALRPRLTASSAEVAADSARQLSDHRCRGALTAGHSRRDW
jgi:hypothetical protein